ncbi:MAG: hypothetical protein HQM08_30705 [Candidatus Riflebacteria bacterium]|nr:hypothetical protein [Candidatus Riflebacteria bacterium]
MKFTTTGILTLKPKKITPWSEGLARMAEGDERSELGLDKVLRKWQTMRKKSAHHRQNSNLPRRCEKIPKIGRKSKCKISQTIVGGVLGFCTFTKNPNISHLPIDSEVFCNFSGVTLEPRGLM